MAETDPITEAQKSFITDLVNKHDLSSLPQAQIDFLKPGSPEKLEANLNRMNRGQASEAIGLLKQLPAIPPTPVLVLEREGGSVDNSSTNQLDFSFIPRAGYYFITDPTDGGEKFYRVQLGKEGTRWEGYVFLHVQASDEFYPVKNKNHREAIFREIAKDPIKSMNEYGMRIGKCGVCGRTLTDRHSILRGIGPICAGRLGPTVEQMELLNKLGLVKREQDS